MYLGNLQLLWLIFVVLGKQVWLNDFLLRHKFTHTHTHSESFQKLHQISASDDTSTSPSYTSPEQLLTVNSLENPIQELVEAY